MKRTRWILSGIVALLLASGSLWAQDQTKSAENNCNKDKSNNCCKSNKPCVHITVHKQLDKDGNIISYDSVYSYTFGGNMADTAFMNSIMQNGNLSIQMRVNPNGSIDFMNDPFLQHFDINDMDQMQKMMEKEMTDFMQNAGMSDLQPFSQPQPPQPAPPVKKSKKQSNPKKKDAANHNNANQGVQI